VSSRDVQTTITATRGPHREMKPTDSSTQKTSSMGRATGQLCQDHLDLRAEREPRIAVVADAEGVAHPSAEPGGTVAFIPRTSPGEHASGSGEINTTGRRCTLGVRRVPLPTRGDHAGGALVRAVLAVLP